MFHPNLTEETHGCWMPSMTRPRQFSCGMFHLKPTLLIDGVLVRIDFGRTHIVRDLCCEAMKARAPGNGFGPVASLWTLTRTPGVYMRVLVFRHAFVSCVHQCKALPNHIFPVARPVPILF